MSKDRVSRSGVSRREFLALAAMTPLLPALSRADMGAVEKNPDVVIVGAGAAGIAAAHVLRKAGVSFALVEAGSRVGGRAWTDTDTFGVPFDRGAHWVSVPEQSPSRNPYYARAREGDYRFYRAEDNYRIFKPEREATADEVDELWQAYADIERRIGRAAERSRDVSPASVVSNEGDWAHTAGFVMGPWSMAKDLDGFSCLDWWNSEGQTDWFCAQGYGTLVADYLGDIPVMLDTAVSRIHWGGSGVKVDTNRGSIRARAVIVTVSTGVLASEGISFEPALSADKTESFHKISMGHYNHIALKFSEDIFDMGENGYLLHQVDDSKEAIGTLTNASGTGLAYCDVGGSFAQELEKAGAEEAIDFALEKLRGVIGSDVDRHFSKGAVTGWGGDAHFRGSYASAEPGAYPLRRELRQQVGDRIYFAGEACHETLWATVSGANSSGTEIARAVVSEIRNDGRGITGLP